MTTSNPSLETISSPSFFNSPNTKAYGAISLALIVFSFAAVLIRMAQAEGISSLMIAGTRLSLASLILTPVVLRRYRHEIQNITRTEVRLAAVAGFFLAIHFTAMALSLEYTSVLVAQVAINTGPLWVALLEMTFLKARLGRLVWVGLLIAVFGSLLLGVGSALTDPEDDSADPDSAVTTQAVADPDESGASEPLLGGVIGLLGAAFSGIYFTAGRKVRATVSLLPYVWMVYGFGGITGLCIAFLTGTPLLGYSMSAYGYLLLLVLLPQLIGHSLFNYAVGFVPATLVTITAQTVTITAGVMAFIVFAEVPSLWDVIGSVVIMGGVMLAIIGQSTRKPARVRSHVE